MSLYNLTYLLTYLFTPWDRVLLEKLTRSWLVKKLTAFYGIRRFITAFTRAATCTYPEPDQSSPCPQPTSWRSNLILSSHLFPSGFSTNSLYATFLSHIRATCPAHVIFLYFITRIIFGEEYRSLNSLLCSFLHSPVTLSILGTNILLSTLLSNTLSTCSSLNVSDRVSHTYKTTGKIL